MSHLLPRRFKPTTSTTSTKPSLQTSTPPRPEQSPSHNNPPPKSSLLDPQSSLPTSSAPTIAKYDSSHLTLGAGVAIFHLASSRVVLCYHTRDEYYFLPKGRKDVDEALTRAAEREGFEESGYRNRLLPLPIAHRQPRAYRRGGGEDEGKSAAKGPEAEEKETLFTSEPIWTQLMPVSRSIQYILCWYIAETVPPVVEKALTSKEKEEGTAYQAPPAFEKGMSLKQRIEMEGKGYEPVRHIDTGVDDEEALYHSELISVEVAIAEVGEKSVSADVIRKGWEAIQRRKELEERWAEEVR